MRDADGRRATIYSVAERAQVSIATVSRALSGSGKVSTATRQRVLDAVHALNYVPDNAARSLAASRHNALGLVLPSGELTGHYYSELLIGFETVAAEQRVSVVLLFADPDGEDAGEPLMDLCSRVDGFAVLNSAGLLGPRRLQALRQHTPIVSIGSTPGTDDDAVAIGGQENAELLVSHVLDHGRRHPVFAGDPELATDARVRWLGFRQALEARGMPVPAPQRCTFSPSSGEAIGRLIASGELDCDAVVCVNDEVALGLCLELRRHGIRVPDDVAVTGWDGTPATRYTTPGITTVAQPVRELGQAAAARLLSRIGLLPEPQIPSHLSTQLILRGSCGCPDDPPRASGSGDPTKENR